MSISKVFWVICFLILNCFRCQWSKWVQLISVVLPSADQNGLSHIELIVGHLAVAKCLRQCPLVVQRTVDKISIRTHLRNAVLYLDSIVTFQSDLVEVWNIETEMRVVS